MDAPHLVHGMEQGAGLGAPHRQPPPERPLGLVGHEQRPVLAARLLQVYVALQRYDTAIEAGINHLVDRQGDKAATLNHLGIAYYLKGDMTMAAYHFQQAADLRPDDAGIRANLDRALRATGRKVASTAVASVDYAATDSTKAAQLEVAYTFYWIE